MHCHTPIPAVLSYLAQPGHVFALDLALTHCRKAQQGTTPCSWVQPAFCKHSFHLSPAKWLFLSTKAFALKKGEIPFQASLGMLPC